MKKIFPSLLLITIVILFNSCDGMDSLSLLDPTGSIEVISITPSSSDYSDGEYVSFTIELEYVLTDAPEGEIAVLINDGSEINTFNRRAEESITEGNGSLTITASTTLKDWGVEGDFEIIIYIIETPYPDPYELIDSSSYIIPVTSLPEATTEEAQVAYSTAMFSLGFGNENPTIEITEEVDGTEIITYTNFNFTELDSYEGPYTNVSGTITIPPNSGGNIFIFDLTFTGGPVTTFEVEVDYSVGFISFLANGYDMTVEMNDLFQ